MLCSCGGVWGSVFIKCNNNLKRFVSNLDWVCCNLVVLRSSRSASSCGNVCLLIRNTGLQMSLAYLSSSVIYTCCWDVDVRHANCFIVAARSSRSALVSRVPRVLLRSYGIMKARETHTERLRFGFVHAQLLKLHTQVSLSVSYYSSSSSSSPWCFQTSLTTTALADKVFGDGLIHIVPEFIYIYIYIYISECFCVHLLQPAASWNAWFWCPRPAWGGLLPAQSSSSSSSCCCCCCWLPASAIPGCMWRGITATNLDFALICCITLIDLLHHHALGCFN